MAKTLSNLNEHFKDKGHIWLICVTMLEIVFYVAYTIIYVILRSDDEIN